MRLSRGWRGLILFWAGIAALGGVGAGILQMMGPPDPIDDSAQDERADSNFVEFASAVPVAVSVAAHAAAVETPSDVDKASAPLAREASPESVTMVAPEPQARWTLTQRLSTHGPSYRTSACPSPSMVGMKPSAGTRQEAPRPEKTRLLRITRDHKLCPTDSLLQVAPGNAAGQASTRCHDRPGAVASGTQSA